MREEDRDSVEWIPTNPNEHLWSDFKGINPPESVDWDITFESMDLVELLMLLKGDKDE